MIRRLPSFFAHSRDATKQPEDSDTIPPPPYTSNPALTPFLLTETRTTRTQVTTTTTETTTETRTHVQPISNDLGGYTSWPSADSRQVPNTGAGSSSFLAIDKALPPTPRSASLASGSPRPSTSSRSSASFPLPSISQLGSSTLAVGLPPAAGLDLINHQSTTPNGASLSFPLLSPATEKTVPAKLRRHKSSHRLLDSSPSSPTATTSERRRSRGLSLGASSWLGLGFASDPKGKGKEKAEDMVTEPAPLPQAAPLSPKSESKTLSRKSSFWTRKKHTTPAPLPAPIIIQRTATAPSSPPLIPSLPSLSFSSSIDLHGPRTSSPTLQSRHGRQPSLARRHSDIFPPTPVKSEFAPPSSYSTLPRPNTAYLPAPNDSLSEPQDQNGRPASTNLDEPAPSPRPRAQTTPPLLHRLSTALFSFSDPPSTHPSPKRSMSSCASPLVVTRDIPKPMEDLESPDVYVSRLSSVVSKAEMAGILASSSDPFYVNALNCFLLRFDFHDEPLDIALRKLLMDVGLPRETQQIDRVMEAFSSRYSDCNPNIFASKDHGYVLAFSLIMLHTDAFNPSNKSKMTKADYVKNTSLAGLPAEVLGCYYDNIVFAPFIFIEDALDINGQVGISPDSSLSQLRTPSTPNLLGRTKIDPYYLITNDLLESMRQDIELLVPLDDPFICTGIGNHAWNDEEVQAAFANAGVIDVQSSMQPNGTGYTSSDSAAEHPSPAGRASFSIKVTKVGVLNRKDDIGQRGKRNTFRKWRTWSVILTGSQLLWFRNSSLAEQVLQLLNDGPAEDEAGISLIKPDEIMSLKDAIAVYDKTYTKHAHTFRFVLSNGRQMLLQASTVEDTDEWLTKINYASAFKTAGVRIRPLGMSPDEVQMTGVAAATSLLHDAQLTVADSSSLPVQPWDTSHSRELMGMLTGDSFSHRPSTSRNRLTILPCDDFDLESMSIVETATSQQFETTFKRVKADLANDNENPYSNDEHPSVDTESPPVTPPTASKAPYHPHIRSSIVRKKVEELQLKLAAIQSQLDDDLRLVRNIAILKPFQRTTRPRLLQPVQAVARKISLLRLDAVRLDCHISVLRRDLEAEHRSMNQMQSIALKAAKKSLDQGTSERVPRMTIPHHVPDGLAREATLRSPFRRTYSSSTTSESFKSAVEYPDEEEVPGATPVSLAPSQLFEPDPTNFNLSVSTTPYAPSNESRSSMQRSPSYSSSKGGSQKESDSVDDLREEAEAWNKTRCAQRVSLIRVPSTLSFQVALPPDGRN